MVMKQILKTDTIVFSSTNSMFYKKRDDKSFGKLRSLNLASSNSGDILLF